MVDLPAPEGPDTTIRLGRRSLNVLHLFAQSLDLGLEGHHVLYHLRGYGLAADGGGFPRHLLGQEIETLARRSLRFQGLPGLGDVAAQALQLLRDVVAIDE